MSEITPSRFGPYEVLGAIGAGGMGEVYRARDPRLNRDVAIKVLAKGSDPTRQRRLLDEAQAASALNHPNIVTVYDVGADAGTPFIVSELVEGESLRARLSRAPLPLRDVLDLGAQMADGLAAAHGAGIVHRDFKPENVMVTRDARVKILDFGIALIGAREGISPSEMAATVTVRMIVGTVPYMSPEQARGSMVDYRTDQFSLGLTLYEMVTGRRAFSAETTAQTLAAILDDEPEPIARVNPKVPAPVRWAIERCLAKDTRQRYESTTDLARELRTLRDRLAEFAPPVEVVPAPPRRSLMLLLAALVAVAAVGVVVGLAGGRADTSLERYQFTPFATDAGYQASPAWSPDGKTLAYVAEVDGVLQVFTRALTSSGRGQVTHGRFDCQDPFWSPDGTRLYYTSRARDRDGLWWISASGGAPELVMENVSRAALSPDGKTLAFFRDAEDVGGEWTLWLSSPPGSTPSPYTRPPFGGRWTVGEATVHFSPDGLKLGTWIVNRGRAEFWVLPLGEGAPHPAPPPSADLPSVTAAFSWLPDSRRVLSALPRPRPGTHMWLMDTERANARLLMATGGFENDPAVSPDGTRLALTFQQADYDLYQFSVGHPSPTVVLATSRNEMDPAWSPAGTEMVFTTDRSGHEEIWSRSLTGGFERPLVTPGDFGENRTNLLSVPAFSPDGQRIAYHRNGMDGNHIWITSAAGGPPIRLTSISDSVEDAPTWSPDGVWVAFVRMPDVTNDHGWSLMKMRVGARTPPVVVTADVAPLSTAQWAPDGKWIAYNSRGGLTIVTPDGQAPRVLHEQAWMGFTWSADSQRLYGIRQSDDLTHLTFTSVELRSGVEHVLGADVMPAPVAREPVRGFTRVSPTTFVVSIVHVRSDVWLLDGFDSQPSLRDRLGAFFTRHP